MSFDTIVVSLTRNAARGQFVEITFFHHRCKTRQVITIIIFWSGKKREGETRKKLSLMLCAWDRWKEPFPPFVILIRLRNSPHNNVKVIYEHCCFFQSCGFSLWIFMFRVTKSLFMSFHYIKGKNEGVSQENWAQCNLRPCAWRWWNLGFMKFSLRVHRRLLPFYHKDKAFGGRTKVRKAQIKIRLYRIKTSDSTG
jgi:hypothetical protein